MQTNFQVGNFVWPVNDVANGCGRKLSPHQSMVSHVTCLYVLFLIQISTHFPFSLISSVTTGERKRGPQEIALLQLTVFLSGNGVMVTSVGGVDLGEQTRQPGVFARGGAGAALQGGCAW